MLRNNIFRKKNLAVEFSSSKEYWEQRYISGGNSGQGSYGHLGAYKAEVINNFVRRYQVQDVIEFGCGDGNQLELAEYPAYIGFDVSPRAIELCVERFSGDSSKRFHLLNGYSGECATLGLSLDVIYHLIEDSVFIEHMKVLFDAAKKYVIIYSSNTDVNYKHQDKHVKHRCFSTWVEEHRKQWVLLEYIQNKYPIETCAQGSAADFYIFEKRI